MGRQSVSLIIILCYHILLPNGAQCTRNPSKEGRFDVETRTKLLDKSSISQYEDILPEGTVPSQRITNTDLMMKDKQVSNATRVTNRPHTYLAVAQTKVGPYKYSGGGGYLKIDHPNVVHKQYSACRIRIIAEYDTIEAGWRVDPHLYGDSRPRVFIRTDGARTHCFNTLCPGFIVTQRGFHFNTPLHVKKKTGGKDGLLRIFIIRDKAKGNWILQVGKKEVGYWPRHLFKGLAGLAHHVEWGGAVYSPPGTPQPQMGSGTNLKGDPGRDGTIAAIKILNELGQESDPDHDLDMYADFNHYSIWDIGILSVDYGRTLFYGGPGQWI